VFLPVLVAVVLGAVLLALLISTRRGIPLATVSNQSALLTAARRASLCRSAGLLVGILFGVAAAATGSLGQGVLPGFALMGTGVLAGVLIGEASIHGPSTGHRTASLRARRLRDHLSRPLAATVASRAGFLALRLAVGTVMGSADDEGRAGRMLVSVCSPTQWGWADPWPGSFYSLPLAVVLLIGCVLTFLGLRQVALRPRLENAGVSPSADMLLRQRSASSVIAAAGIAVNAPLVGVAAISGMRLLTAECAPGWWRVAGWLCLACVPAALGIFAWCAAVLLRPVVPVQDLQAAR